MYTLRKFNEEGIENNVYLGKEYTFIKRHEVKSKTFLEVYKEALGSNHVADLDETATECSKDCAGFVVGENGVMHYISKKEGGYIMSPNGSTLCKL